MNPLLKSLLLPLLLILTALPIQAEEDKWIDGIKIRFGLLTNKTAISLPWKGQIQSIKVRDDFSHLEDIAMFPVAITLPETLMNSWSFRGALLEWHNSLKEKDIPPDPDDKKIQSDTTNWRQRSSLRTSLYNDFFNASDKAFADANSNWALSADVTSSRVFLGYYMGVFIPVGEYHRFAKIGAGLGVYYMDMLLKLNLCSQYKITPMVENGDVTDKGHGGACVGKTEIDSSSYKGFGLALVHSITIWERVTKDSVWKILSWEEGTSVDTPDLKLKNHSKNLGINIEIESLEWISYTYRF